MTQEYVASLTYGPQLTKVRVGKRTLPKHIDDLQRNVRFDIYETMMLDAQVKSCLGVYIAGVLGGGMDILPASKATDPKFQTDSEVARFCEDALKKHMKTPFLSEYLPDMMKAIALGHRISEKVTYKDEESPVPGKMLFKYAKVKPRKRVVFVVDDYLNVIGIANTPPLGFSGELKVYPRDKFAILTWKPCDADPRGTSDFRAIYEAWWNKQKIRPMHLQFLHQFASPSLIGILAEASSIRQQIDPATGQPMVDENGRPIYVDKSQEMKTALEQFQNSSILVIPYGAEVVVVEVKGNGEAFITALNDNNSEIAKGLLLSTLSTEQGPNQGRAASTVHADVVSVGIDAGIEQLERFIEQEFLAQLVAWNYPPGTAVPRCRLPGANKADFLAWASAIAKLEAAGYLDPSQYDGTDAKLNLPKRSVEAMQETIDAKTKEREMVGSKPIDPNLPATQTPKAKEKAKITDNFSDEEADTSLLTAEFV